VDVGHEAGLREQIAIDEAEVERMWKHVEVTVQAITSLKAHIAENKAKLE